MDSPLPTTTQRADLHARLARVRAEAEGLRLLADGDAVRLDAEATRLALTLKALDDACAHAEAEAAALPARVAAAAAATEAAAAANPRDADERRRANFAALRQRPPDPDPPAQTALRLHRARAWALLQEAAARLGRVEAAFGLRDAAPCPMRDPPFGGRAEPPCLRTASLPRLPSLPSLGGAWLATRDRARRRAAERALVERASRAHGAGVRF